MDENEIDSSELLAMNVLTETNIINKDDFNKSESPDFISKNGNIGIEITIVNNSIAYGKEAIKGIKIENARNKKAYVKKLGGNVMSINDAKAQNKFVMYEENNLAYVSFDLDTGFDLINQSIEKKLKKLQEYKTCKEYRLFIIAPCLFIQAHKGIHEIEVEQEIKNIEKLFYKYNLIYNTIYIYNGNVLYTINMEEKTFSYKYLDIDINLLKKSNII